MSESQITKASNPDQDAINAAFNRIKEPEPIGGTGWTLHQYDNRVKAAKMYFEEGVKLGMQLAKRKL